MTANLKPVDFKAVAAQGAYVYCYLREDGSPYYVGLAGNSWRPTQKHRTARGGVQIPVDRNRIRVMKSGLSREEACRWEMFYINHYGRKDLGTGILRNGTVGGDNGSAGMVHTEEWKLAQSRRQQGVSLSEAAKAKIREAAACRPSGHYDCHRGRLSHKSTVRTWQHGVHGTVDLTQTELIERFPGPDQGNLAKVVAGKIKQHKGWRCLTPDKEFVAGDKAAGNRAGALARLANNAAKLGMAVEEYSALSKRARARCLKLAAA